MSQPETPDRNEDLDLLHHRLGNLQEQLDELRVLITAWPAALLCVAGLIVPMFRELVDAGTPADVITLLQLPGEASEAENGATQIVAIVVAIALAGTAIASAAAALTRNSRVALGSIVAGATPIVAWVILALAVNASEGGGVVDELGYENTVGLWIVPAAAGIAIVAGRTVRSVTR